MTTAISASLMNPLSAGEKPVVAVQVLPSAAAAAERRSFHLALLLDTSGSMDGVRIDSLRRTLHLLVDEISAGDAITLIEYSSKAKILASAMNISDENRSALHTIIDGLRADGGTNLSEALECLRSVSGIVHGAGAEGDEPLRPKVDAVFLLTDGQVNAGITATAGLLHLLNSAVIRGTPVFTLGYGEDHNASLLRTMALHSRGSYTFADVDEMLPACIGDILGGLTSEVGRNASLMIPEGWKTLELGGGGADNTYTIGTLIADKPQWVVLEGPEGTTELPTVRLNWSIGTREFVEDCVVNDAIPSIEVVEQYERCRTATVFESVEAMIARYDVHAARVALETHAGELDASPAKDRTLVIRLRAQIESMIASLPVSPGGLGLPGARGHPGAGALLTRLASGMTAIGVQRGFLSGPSTSGDSVVDDPISLTAVFSSPAQRRITQTLVTTFSQAEPDVNA